MYKRAVNETRATLLQQRSQLTYDQNTLSVLKVPRDTNSLAAIEHALKLTDDFAGELSRIQNAPHPRSGSISVAIGMLNSGASDGTIYNEATLEFEGGKMSVYAEKYTPIPLTDLWRSNLKAHMKKTAKYSGLMG